MLIKNSPYFTKVTWTTHKVSEEIQKGLMVLKKIKKPIVFFAGGHSVKPGSKEYKHAEELAYKLGKEGFAIITGGGPGVMEAANKGAIRAGTDSIGLKAKLLSGEQVAKNHLTHRYDLHFMFTRRFLLLIKTEAVLIYPGGWGTVNELSENAMLMDTGLVDKVPMIAVGKSFWKGLFKWMQESPKKQGLAPKSNKFLIENDHTKIINLIKRKTMQNPNTFHKKKTKKKTKKKSVKKKKKTKKKRR